MTQKSPSGHHHTSLSGYIFATKADIDNRKKNILSSNIFSTCCYNMVNFGPLAAEIISLVWDTPANFNGFRVLASLLHRRRSTEANQTLHDVWPSPGLVDYLHLQRTTVARGEVRHSSPEPELPSPAVQQNCHECHDYFKI